jgi:membrane-associated phospholipid phosphatase
MNITKRVRLVILVVLCQCVYTLTNRMMHGGVLLDTPLDHLIPLWPIWVVPYFLMLGVWVSFDLWALFKMEDRLFKAYIIASLVTIVPSMMIFIFWPTYVLRPQITGQDWASNLLRLLYANDQPNNAFPSGHMYFAVLVAYFGTRWKPGLRWPMIAMVMMIIGATLFTKQHYVLDLVGGAAMAAIGTFVGITWVFGGNFKRDKGDPELTFIRERR